MISQYKDPRPPRMEINCNPTCTSQDCAGCRLATRESARGRAPAKGPRQAPYQGVWGLSSISVQIKMNIYKEELVIPAQAGIQSLEIIG